MIVNEQNKNTRGASHAFFRNAAVLATGVCTALSLTNAARAETHFVPRFGADATWTDNVQLAPPGGQEDSELILQARPGLSFSHYSQRLQTFADYTLQAVHFTDSSDTETYHQVQLGLLGEILQDWFYVDLGAQQSQASVDPSQRVNVGNLFQVGNVADVRSVYITPMIRHRFRWAQLNASYTRAKVDYSEANDLTTINTAQDDSDNENIAVGLSSIDPEDLITWNATYGRQKVEYDIGLPYRYDKATAEIGLRVAAPLRLIARGGMETDPRIRSDEGGLDESSWAAGFQWKHGERMELRALAGRRFFGNTYELEWSYAGRVLEANVNYNEAATTESQSRVLTGVNPPGGFPTEIDPRFDRITNDVYILKALGGRIGLRGRLTEIFIALRSEEREYLAPFNGLEDKYKGANVLVTRRLGPRLNLQASGGYTKSNLREGIDYNEYIYNLTLARQLGNRTALTFSGNRVNRGGPVGYNANWVVLGFTMNFGAPGEVGGKGGYRPIGAGRGTNQPARPTLPTGPRQP